MKNPFNKKEATKRKLSDNIEYAPGVILLHGVADPLEIDSIRVADVAKVAWRLPGAEISPSLTVWQDGVQIFLNWDHVVSVSLNRGDNAGKFIHSTK